MTLSFDSLLKDPQMQEIAVKFPQNESCKFLLQIVLHSVVKMHITAFLMLILLEFTTETLLQIALKNVLSTASLPIPASRRNHCPQLGLLGKNPGVLGPKFSIVCISLSNLLPCFCQQDLPMDQDTPSLAHE